MAELVTGIGLGQGVCPGRQLVPDEDLCPNIPEEAGIEAEISGHGVIEQRQPGISDRERFFPREKRLR